MNDVEASELSQDISDVRWFDIPVLIIFWTLFVVVLLQFFTRYVLNDSLGWTEEIARYLLIGVCFVGGVTCVRKGSHIALEFFYRYLADGMIKPLRICVEGIVVVFWAWAGYLCIGLAQRTRSSMVSIDLPKSTIYWVVVAACFAMALMAAINIVKLSRQPTTDIKRELLAN